MTNSAKFSCDQKDHDLCQPASFAELEHIVHDLEMTADFLRVQCSALNRCDDEDVLSTRIEIRAVSRLLVVLSRRLRLHVTDQPEPIRPEEIEMAEHLAEPFLDRDWVQANINPHRLL